MLAGWRGRGGGRAITRVGVGRGRRRDRGGYLLLLSASLGGLRGGNRRWGREFRVVVGTDRLGMYLRYLRGGT